MFDPATYALISAAIFVALALFAVELLTTSSMSHWIQTRKTTGGRSTPVAPSKLA